MEEGIQIKQELFCMVCDIHFEKKSELNYHNSKVHYDKQFECGVCFKKFIDRYTLKVHIRSHTGEKPYICLYCKRAFSQACNLLTHKKKFHYNKLKNHNHQQNSIMHSIKVEGNSRTFGCPHCRSTFQRLENLKAHILSSHSSRKENGINSRRSTSTSSGVSTASSSSERLPPIMHCHKCKLAFGDRISYQRHMYAHAKQQQSQNKMPQNDSIQISNSNGETVNLKELVSKIRNKHQMAEKKTKDDVLHKLNGLGMEISVHAIKKNDNTSETNDLGLVISNVQSVSQSFFDELENKKPASHKIIKNSSKSRTNGVSPSPSTSSDDRDPLEIFSNKRPISAISIPPGPKSKKQKLIESISNANNDDIILSSTRRTSRAIAYNESDQPKYVSIVYKQKNGKTSKKRIFPCGQCSCKFENIETRKMHFMSVHGSAKSRIVKSEEIIVKPTIIPEIIPAFDPGNDETFYD
uniref:CSON013396 protein n=1 Tax=Culicoides sonorensis TaxID=179676 RepID=A0A336M7S5_CULSO